MLQLQERTRIAAPVSRVWPVLADVERWPEWTSSMNEVTLLDSPDLRLGARTRVAQPRLPVLVWTVEELVDGERFTWRSGSPGGVARARHVLTPIDDGSCELTLTMEQTGLSELFGRLAIRLERRYLAAEADGLRGYCERRAGQ